jgi:hypothetical protein
MRAQTPAQPLFQRVAIDILRNRPRTHSFGASEIRRGPWHSGIKRLARRAFLPRARREKTTVSESIRRAVRERYLGSREQRMAPCGA